MRMQAETINLGDHVWQIRPLTLAQVQAIEPVLFCQTEGNTIATALAVIRIALARDHAEAASALGDIEAAAPDVASAMSRVLRLGGFLPQEAISGEGQAG